MAERKHIVVFHGGGLSDLVLGSGFLAALRRQEPQARLSLWCLEPVAGVAPLLGTHLDEVVGLPLDPRAWAEPSEELYASIRRLFAQLRPEDAHCDLFIAAANTPTWLTPVVGAALAPGRAIGRPAPAASGGMVDAILRHFGLEAIEFVADRCGPATRELERYAALLALLDIHDSPSPELVVPAEARARAAEICAGIVDADSPLLACFNAAEPLQRWPLQSLSEAIVKAASEFALRPLLVAGTDTPSEREHIAELAAALHAAGTGVAVLPAGLDIPAIAGVLARCRAFLGADAALADVASALDLPGVTVCGGGLWPAFQPWSPRTVGLVHPLPCFGCQWDCGFGRAICLDAIDSDSVVRGLHQALNAPGGGPTIIERANLPAGELAVIADASRHYRVAQQDRGMRLNALVQLKERLEHDGRQVDVHAQLVLKEAELQRLATAVADLRAHLERKEADLQALIASQPAVAAQIHALGTENETLRRVAQERLEALQSAQAATAEAIDNLKRVAEERLVALDESKKEREALQHVAQERLTSLELAQRANETLRGVAEERLASLEAARLENEALQHVAQERLASLEAARLENEALQRVAEERRFALEETETERNIFEQIAGERLAALDKSQAENETLLRVARERLVALDEAERASEALKRENDALLAIAEERLAALHQSRAENATLLQVAAERLASNDALQQAAAERLAALEASQRAQSAIEAEGERRSLLLADLTALLEERNAEIERLNARRPVRAK